MGVTENPRDVFASCAIVWTRDKRCFQRQWQLTQPRTKNEHDARWARGLAHGLEPAVTLRTSGLIGFEADSAEDVVRLQAALGEADVTAWVVEYRDTPEGRRLHVYVRQPLPALELPKVSYRFEGGQLIAAANNYYRCAYDDGPYQLLSVNEDAPPMTAEAYDYSSGWRRRRSAESGLAFEQVNRWRRDRGGTLSLGSRASCRAGLTTRNQRPTWPTSTSRRTATRPSRTSGLRSRCAGPGALRSLRNGWRATY
jgi:hypothetical protein